MGRFRREVHHKLRVLKHAEQIGDVGKACRYFGVGRASFYRWRAAYRRDGEVGPRQSQNHSEEPCQSDSPRDRREGPPSSEDLSSRSHAHRLVLGALSRHHDLGRRCLSYSQAARPEPSARRHAGSQNPTRRYRETGAGPPDPDRRQVPELQRQRWRRTKRYQYTAIDDATRIRALKIYNRHNQANAIDFVEYRDREVPVPHPECAPTTATNSRPSSTGTSRTAASGTPISSPNPAAQRQGRTVAQIRPGGVLSAPHLHRRRAPTVRCRPTSRPAASDSANGCNICCTSGPEASFGNAR